jgi:hypothetical protein
MRLPLKLMLKLIWIAGIALCAAREVRAGNCQVVAGNRILGRDLAAAVPELVGLDPEAGIAPAPLAGVERVLHTEEVARIALDHALPPPGRTIEACFVRKTSILTPEQLALAIEQAFGADRAGPPSQVPSLASQVPSHVPSYVPPQVPNRVEILDFSRYPVPEGKLEFPGGALAASGVWHGRVVTPEGRSVPVWVRVKVNDAVTGSPVPLGPSAGEREVNRGDPVQVRVSSGRATISFDSVAESSGRKGDMVLVTSPDKRRRLLARVEEKGKVSIKK